MSDALYRQTLHAMEAEPGPDHPDLAPVLANLADLHRARGAMDDARTLETRARAVRTASVRPDHPTLTILNR
ncbi:tetratricopeptide repeat protein [Streptomyces sp. NPDC059371]|uniref:tetratricopeptide repeat protein n=1 Tax=Streptomyces sp. NPDC059371 TaxID=3346812 RepID=UPI003680CC45